MNKRQVFELKGYKGKQYIDIVHHVIIPSESERKEEIIDNTIHTNYTDNFFIYFYDINPQKKAIELYNNSPHNIHWLKLSQENKNKWIDIAKNLLKQSAYSYENNIK